MDITNENIKDLLRLIIDGEHHEERIGSYNEVEGFDHETLEKTILRCKAEGYIKIWDREIIIRDLFGDWKLNPEVEITDSGLRFLRDEKNTSAISNVYYNITHAENSQIGGSNNFLLNVNYGGLIDKLKEVVDEMDCEDKLKGEELISKLETEKLNSGFLKSFASFISSNPLVSNLVGNIILHLAIS